MVAKASNRRLVLFLVYSSGESHGDAPNEIALVLLRVLAFAENTIPDVDGEIVTFFQVSGNIVFPASSSKHQITQVLQTRSSGFFFFRS